MRKAPVLNMAGLRRARLHQTLAEQLAGLQRSGHFSAEHIARTATLYLDRALRLGFSIDHGGLRVGLMMAGHGVGFLHDAQHHQMAALFRADIQMDEGWWLALLQQWTAWQTARQVAASPAATIAWLRTVVTLIQSHGVAVLAHDPATLYAAVDPAKTALHDAAH